MLKEITLPASLKTVGEEAFRSCPDLTKVTVLSKNINLDTSQLGILPIDFNEGYSSKAFMALWNEYWKAIYNMEAAEQAISDAAEALEAGEITEAEYFDVYNNVYLAAEDLLTEKATAYCTYEDEYFNEDVDYEYRTSDILTVYGYADSTAKTYADECELKFVDIGKKEEQPSDTLDLKEIFDKFVSFLKTVIEMLMQFIGALTK